MKKLIYSLLGVAMLIGCAAPPKYNYHFGHYKYESKAKSAVAANEAVATTEESAKSEPVAYASTENTVVVEPTASATTVAPVVKVAPSKNVVSEMTRAEKKAAKQEVKAHVKAFKKEIKQGNSRKAEGKSQIIAAILAFVVGGLGIHRFYLGYMGIGVAQLLTGGGCGIWALIDFVRILMGDLQPKDGSYAKTL